MEDCEAAGTIRNVGHGDCYALYFMVENVNWKWYNQIVNHNIKKIQYVNLFIGRHKRTIT